MTLLSNSQQCTKDMFPSYKILHQRVATPASNTHLVVHRFFTVAAKLLKRPVDTKKQENITLRQLCSGYTLTSLTSNVSIHTPSGESPHFRTHIYIYNKKIHIAYEDVCIHQKLICRKILKTEKRRKGLVQESMRS